VKKSLSPYTSLSSVSFGTRKKSYFLFITISESVVHA
jgi:hypothetical protein